MDDFFSDWPVEVVVRPPPLGRCLAATREISPGEVLLAEKPALQTQPQNEEQIDDPCAVLRAYCAAPPDVRSLVVDSLATIEYDERGGTSAKAREAAEQVAASEDWAGGHSVETLQRAIMAFRLNGHSFGDSSALFPHLCKMQHSCSPNAIYQVTTAAATDNLP